MRSSLHLGVQNVLRKNPFHSRMRRLVARILLGASYLALRDRCGDIEPEDEPGRRTRAHELTLGVVADFRDFNSENVRIQSAPIIGPELMNGSTVEGFVISTGRPYRDRIAGTDLVLNGVVYYHVVLFDGVRFIALFVRSGFEPPNVLLDYRVAREMTLSVVSVVSEPTHESRPK